MEKPTQILKKKTSNALKADGAMHRVTFNPNRASPGEVLRVPVPKLDDIVVLVPGSLSPIFDARALVDRLTVKFAREILQSTDGYDPFKLYEDLFLTKNERASVFREGIQSVDLSKIRCNAEDKKKPGVDRENNLNDVYQNKYRIPLDHEILNDHGLLLKRSF